MPSVEKGDRTQKAVVSNLVGPAAGNATSTVAFVSCTGGQEHQMAKPQPEICSKTTVYSKAVYCHTQASQQSKHGSICWYRCGYKQHPLLFDWLHSYAKHQMLMLVDSSAVGVLKRTLCLPCVCAIA